MFMSEKALDRIQVLQEYTERASVLLDEIESHFLSVLEFAAEHGDHEKVKMIAVIDARRIRIKAETTLDIINVIGRELGALVESAIHEQGPESDNCQESTNTPTEEEMRETMVTETLNQINDFVSVIEEKPDFLRRMATLKETAMLLATGHEIHLAELPQK